MAGRSVSSWKVLRWKVPLTRTLASRVEVCLETRWRSQMPLVERVLWWSK